MIIETKLTVGQTIYGLSLYSQVPACGKVVRIEIGLNKGNPVINYCVKTNESYDTIPEDTAFESYEDYRDYITKRFINITPYKED